MKNILIILCITVTTVWLTSCGDPKAKNSAESGKEHEHAEAGHEEHENESTVTLTAEQIKSIKLELGSIEKKQLTSSLRANGILKVPNQNKASVTSMLGGIVKTISVQPGNSVRKGQVIATIANTAFIVLQEDFLSISAKSELGEIELERQKELNKGNAGSLKILQQTEAEIKGLKARKSSLQKQLELFGINPSTLNSDNVASVLNLTSPIDGVISTVTVNIGSSVDANTTIAEIVDNSQLHLDLYVYEKDLPKLKAGQIIHFTLTNNPGKEYDAEVYAVSNTFEESSKAVAVHAKVKGNKQGLIDGMSITALLSLESATQTAVPTEAIVSHEGQDFIFVMTDAHAEEEHHSEEASEAGHKHDEHGHEHKEKENDTKEEGTAHHDDEGTTFEKIPVRKGTTDVGYSEITVLKEIPADAKIVIKGAFFVLAKMSNKGEGHHH